MFSKFFSNWLFSILKCSEGFDEYVNQKMKSYYVNETLSLYRIWGDYSRVKFGKNVQVNNAIFNTESGEIVIDDFTFFGHNVSLLTGTHDYKSKNDYRQSKVPSVGRDIHIGKGVWIASNVTIVGPCKIGDNCVIAANSLITGEIKKDSLYAGVPAKFIKEIRFDNEE